MKAGTLGRQCLQVDNQHRGLECSRMSEDSDSLVAHRSRGTSSFRHSRPACLPCSRTALPWSVLPTWCRPTRTWKRESQLSLTKESQSYYLHFGPHPFRKQFGMRLFLKPVTQNCWFTLVWLESKDHVWIGDSSLGRWRKEQTEPCPRGRDVPYVEAVTTSSASRWDDLTQPTPSLILSSRYWFSTDRTTRKSGNCEDTCILRRGKARFARSLKSLNCFSFPCGMALPV